MLRRAWRVLVLVASPLPTLGDWQGVFVAVTLFLGWGSILLPDDWTSHLPEMPARIAILCGVMAVLAFIAALKIQTRLDELNARHPLTFKIQPSRHGANPPQGEVAIWEHSEGTPRPYYLRSEILVRFENSDPHPIPIRQCHIQIIDKRRWRREHSVKLGNVIVNAIKDHRTLEVYKGVPIAGRSISSPYWVQSWILLLPGTEAILGPNHFIRLTMDAVGQESFSRDVPVDWDLARRRGTPPPRPEGANQTMNELTENLSLEELANVARGQPEGDKGSNGE